MRKHWREADNRLGLLFIAPFVLAALVFMVYPVVESIRMAFYYIDPLNPDGQRFAGLADARAGDDLGAGELAHQHVADQPADQLRAVHYHHPGGIGGHVAQLVLGGGHVSVGRVCRR